MLAVLKSWSLFLVSGSGPTGFKGGNEEWILHLEHIHKFEKSAGKSLRTLNADFFQAIEYFMDMLLTDGQYKLPSIIA
jgi:hypothetical protein